MFYTESTMQSSQEQIFWQEVFLQRTTTCTRKNQKLSRKSNHKNTSYIHNYINTWKAMYIVIVYVTHEIRCHDLRENLKRRTFTPSKSQMEHFFEFSISRKKSCSIPFRSPRLISARVAGTGAAAGSGVSKAPLFKTCLYRCAWALSYLDLIGQLLSISLELKY